MAILANISYNESSFYHGNAKILRKFKSDEGTTFYIITTSE